MISITNRFRNSWMTGIIIVTTLLINSACSTSGKVKALSDVDKNIVPRHDVNSQFFTDTSGQSLYVVNHDEGIYITEDRKGQKYLKSSSVDKLPIQLYMLSTGKDQLIQIDQGRFYISSPDLYKIKNYFLIPEQVVYITRQSAQIFSLCGSYYFENKKGLAYRGIYQSRSHYIVFTVETRFNPARGALKKICSSGNVDFGILRETSVSALSNIGKYADDTMTSKRIARILNMVGKTEENTVASTK